MSGIRETPAPKRGKAKKRLTPTARTKQMRRALIELIEAIDFCGSFEIEAGEYGFGPLYWACKAARVPLPENFRDWRKSPE